MSFPNSYESLLLLSISFDEFYFQYDHSTTREDEQKLDQYRAYERDIFSIGRKYETNSNPYK
jgi:hypothetical protein